jgi:tyrosyl-tRNA synthetase
MFAKVLSISDDADVALLRLLSQRPEAEVAALRAKSTPGRNPKDAKVSWPSEITGRFHSAAAVDAADDDFQRRASGGVPDEIPEVALTGAPLAIGAVLKQAAWCLRPVKVCA